MKNNFGDPRSRVGFQPQFYPTANGKHAPPSDSSGQNDRIVIEFLAAYYRLNCEYARLLEVRQQPAGSHRHRAERKCLQTLEKALISREALEDRYAPIGVIAEPTIRDGFTLDLTVSFGNVDAAGRTRFDLRTFKAYVPVPLPTEIKLENLVLSVVGPETVASLLGDGDVRDTALEANRRS